MGHSPATDAPGADAPVDLGRLPGRFAFLKESRWIGLIAAMIVVSVVCVFLGRWQWDRHHQRSAFAEQVATAYEAPVASLPDVLGDPPEPVTVPTEWHRVELTGSYVPGAQVMLRARPVDGTPAVHVLDLFEATSSAGEPIAPLLLVIDRGWLPAAAGDAIGRGEAPMPAPPDGEVSLDARLRLAEEPDARTASPGIVLRIEPSLVIDAAEQKSAVADTSTGTSAGTSADTTAGTSTDTTADTTADTSTGTSSDTVAQAVEGAAVVLDGYAQAAAERVGGAEVAGGAVSGGNGQPIRYERPSTALGNNLSYAFQWWFFAVGAQIAWLLLARREADDREDEILLGLAPGHPGGPGGAAGHHRGALPQGARSRPRARTLDDDVEDAVLDRALRRG